MTILDTFFMLFEADTSKLDKGLDGSRDKANKTTEAVKNVDDAAFKMGQSLGRAIAQAGGAILAGLSLNAMAQAILSAADAADKLGEATSRFGLNVEEISAWGDIVKKNGGSVDSFIGSIDGLNNVLSMMEVTGKSRAAPFLKELGIDLENVAYKGKNATELLLPIAAAMEGMDRQKSSAIGRKLGLDQATILTLQGGRREVEALIARERELGVITKEQTEIAGKFNDQLDDTSHAFRSLWLTVGQSVLPALEWVAKKFEQVALFMRKHSDFIVGLMIALGTAISVFVLPALYRMAAAALVAFAPFLLIGAAVAALALAFALLYDDVMNFVEGNDSLIGQMLERWPVIGTVISAIVDIVKALGSAVAWTFQTMFSVLQISFDLWRRAITTILEFTGHMGALRLVSSAVGETFAALGKLAGMIWDAIIAKIQAAVAVMGAAVNLVKGIAGAITGGLGGAKLALGITGPTADGLAAGKGVLAAAGGTPLASQTSNSIANTRGGDRNVSIGKVDVHTQATDAAGISKSIGGALGSQMRQTTANFDDGIAA